MRRRISGNHTRFAQETAMIVNAVSSNAVQPTVLTSWKDIARYMGKGVRTVQRWELDFGLPVRRAEGSNKKAVLARPRDLDAWVATQCSIGHSSHETEPRRTNICRRSSLSVELETYRTLRRDQADLRLELRSALRSLQEAVAACHQQCAPMQSSTDQQPCSRL